MAEVIFARVTLVSGLVGLAGYVALNIKDSEDLNLEYYDSFSMDFQFNREISLEIEK